MKRIAIPVSTSKTQYYINQAYVDYVSESGLIPVLVTPGCERNSFVDVCDGLLLPGGVDLEPTFYGEGNIASYNVEPEKDDFERKLFYSFLSEEKSVFGICRGFQLVLREYLARNPKNGRWLTYYQHVGDHALADSLSIPRSVPSHFVEVRSDLYGGKTTEYEYEDIFVNSMHHQVVIMDEKKKPEGRQRIEIVATTTVGLETKEVEEGKSVVEGVRIRGKSTNILAVQWHPEELRDYALLQNFFGVEVDNTVDVELAKIGGQND